MDNHYILAINPGSTSMKMAIFENDKKVHEYKESFSSDQLAGYMKVIDQVELREESIKRFINSIGETPPLSAVVGRGGVVGPLKSGAYEVNDLLVNRLSYKPMGEHASNLGGVLATRIAWPLGIKAYVYDCVSVSEQRPLSYLTGFKGVLRYCRCHILNMRAQAIKAAQEMEKRYDELNIIVAHLGGGITLTLHERGRITDMVLDSEGALSPERAGRLPLNLLINYCKQLDIHYDQLTRMTRGGGGIVSLLGTNNAQEVEKRVLQGDKMALLVYKSMAYQVAKSIGELSTVVKGNVDLIILTGAMSFSNMLTDWIEERVSFISKVRIIPGEDELEALSRGVLRVLRGEETAHIYDEETDNWSERNLLQRIINECAQEEGMITI